MPDPVSPARPSNPRGRPPTITRARIAAAGIAMTLPRITVVGVAQALGVSHIALYKHVASLEALKRLVAEAIFAGWQAPPLASPPCGAEHYLLAFARSLRTLVDRNPGLAPYLVRHGAKTAAMAERIHDHHHAYAAAYAVSPAQARWLLSTVAYHCIALADTVYSIHLAPLADIAGGAPEGAATRPAAALEAEFELGMRALVVGALALQAEAAD